MSMTEREVADNAAKVIRCAVTVDKDQRFFSQEGRERACLMRDHFERRVTELEAAEKEAKPFAMDHRVAGLEALELDIRRLERITNSANARFARHVHHNTVDADTVQLTSGPKEPGR